MFWACWPIAALLCLCAGAYVLRMRTRMAHLAIQLSMAAQRESSVLEAARVLTAASRESTGAVLAALDRALRALEPSVDAVLIFVPSGENLHCVYAGGERAEHFSNARMRRDHTLWLPARAAQCAHRVELNAQGGAVIPTDRAALAVPMMEGGRLCAVVYAAAGSGGIAHAGLLVRAVEQAAAPYALAADREFDRVQATFDSLTGLYTPRAFRARLQQDVSLARTGTHSALALWFIDTDHFKKVNDALGHAAGDLVLQAMAALLKSHTVDGADTAARNGGDEFCAILRDVQKVAAIERAQRLCTAVRDYDFGVGVRVTASVGVAAFPYDAGGANELLEVADAGMYHSKRSGRGCVSFALGGGGFAVYR